MDNQNFIDSLSHDKDFQQLFKQSLSNCFVEAKDWYLKRTGKSSLGELDFEIIAMESSNCFLAKLIGKELDE